MNSLFTLIVLAMFIEAFITYIQTIYKEGSIQWQIVVGFIIAVVLCFDTGINFFAILGLPEQWPVVGVVATGVVICRGSNYLFEFYNQLTGWRHKVENEAEPIKTVNFID